jgi:hypothetical protein
MVSGYFLVKHFCTLPWLKIEPKLGKTTCRGGDILWMTLYFDGMGGQDVLHRNVLFLIDFKFIEKSG